MGRFDLLTTNLDKNTQSLNMHVNDDKIGISTKSKR